MLKVFNYIFPAILVFEHFLTHSLHSTVVAGLKKMKLFFSEVDFLFFDFVVNGNDAIQCLASYDSKRRIKKKKLGKMRKEKY